MSGGETIQLSVIICTHNRSALLMQALESLELQTLDPWLMEVIVVDNNSTDNTQELLGGWHGRLRNFRTVREEKLGLSHARNLGWQEALGEFVAFLDDDAKAAPSWAERVLAAFHSVDPLPACVGGPIYPFYDTLPPKWFADFFEVRSWGEKPCFLTGERARYGFSGSNMVFQRRILESMGGVSPQFGMVGKRVGLGEETELFLRIYRVSPLFWYDPEILVHHYISPMNMRLKNRLIRRFRSGQTRAVLDQREFFSRASFQAFCSLFIIAGQTMRSVFQSSGNRSVQIVDGLHKISYQLGFLIG